MQNLRRARPRTGSRIVKESHAYSFVVAAAVEQEFNYRGRPATGLYFPLTFQIVARSRSLEKHEEEKRARENALLMKPVQTQKVPFGVDPKTVLCAFHKAGVCDKGNKCKFSHDLNIGRKVEKRNLYEDSREDKLEGVYLP